MSEMDDSVWSEKSGEEETVERADVDV